VWARRIQGRVNESKREAHMVLSSQKRRFGIFFLRGQIEGHIYLKDDLREGHVFFLQKTKGGQENCSDSSSLPFPLLKNECSLIPCM